MPKALYEFIIIIITIITIEKWQWVAIWDPGSHKSPAEGFSDLVSIFQVTSFLYCQ